MQTFKGNHKIVKSIDVSSNGKYIVSGSKDNNITLWDVSTGSFVRTYTGHAGSVSSVAFSPDGRLITSSSNDKSIIVWDVVSGNKVRTISANYGKSEMSFLAQTEKISLHVTP